MQLPCFVTKYLIRSSDLIKLVSYSDDDKLKKRMESVLSNTKNGFILTTPLSVLTYSILCSAMLDVGYHTMSVNLLLFLFTFYTMLIALRSVFFNLLIAHSSYTLTNGILTNWIGVVSNYLTIEQRRNLTEFQTDFSSYYFQLSNLVTNNLRFLAVIVALFFSSSILGTKAVFSLITLIFVLLMMVSGNYLKKTMVVVRDKTLKLDTLNTKLKVTRALFPTIYNTLDALAPFVLVILVWFKINSIVAQVGFLLVYLTMYFDMIETLHKFEFAKINLVKVNSILELVSSTYIINAHGYKILCGMCAPSAEVKGRSLANKSLILKDFVPMAITNQKEITHVYNYEFLPGAYQLNGINGIGKTTLLESLTLPERIRVEFSKGEVAYLGQDFFNESLTLKDHREKYIYIGTNASQKEDTVFGLDLFNAFPNTLKFLQAFMQNNKPIQSEGEKAVISICFAYYKIKTSAIKLVIIDESLSRIYNDDTYPLRQEIIELVCEMSRLDSVIIIVVDHMTKLPYAKQLHFEKKSIVA